MAKEKIEDYDDEFDELDDLEEEKPKKKKEKKTQTVQLPVMLELVYSFSLIFTIVMSITVGVISFLSGAEWLDVFIRTAITILSTGLLMWMFSLMISNGALKTLKVLQEEAVNGQNQTEKNQDDFSEMENTDVEDSEG